MPLRRDLLIVLLALSAAATIYVVSFRDLMAGAAPASQVLRISGQERG